MDFLNFILIIISLILAGITVTKTVKSRAKHPDRLMGDFFQPTEIHDYKLPLKRHGYSDRISLLLAELSDLAYLKFEERPDVDKIRAELGSILSGEISPASIEELVNIGRNNGSKDVLEKILKTRQFDLVATVTGPRTTVVGMGLQALEAFVCKYVPPKGSELGEPFLVVAFRGSELDVSDWLTNLDADPEDVENFQGLISNLQTKIHRGFFRSLCSSEQSNKQSALEQIRALIESKEHKNLPVFFTGHSLGGAWAQVATVLLSKGREGACYTYGAPRVASYEFFFENRMPIYRVVNSSDIVPRVPPSASVILFLSLICKAVNALFRFEFVDLLEEKLNRLKYYRHSGDLRYLTDVEAGMYSKTRLISNPSVLDQIEWFWKSILVGMPSYPVKSHSMAIYRKKLRELVKSRYLTSRTSSSEE